LLKLSKFLTKNRFFETPKLHGVSVNFPLDKSRQRAMALGSESTADAGEAVDEAGTMENFTHEK
jgi:hypothetical protein